MASKPQTSPSIAVVVAITVQARMLLPPMCQGNIGKILTSLYFCIVYVD